MVLVTAASVQDNAGGIALTQHVAARYPSVARAWVDQDTKRAVAEDAARHGIDVRVYAKDPAVKGFAATPRWPVERTYGWLVSRRPLDRRLRDAAGPVSHPDSLGHDRQHGQKHSQRNNTDMAGTSLHNGSTGSGLDETPSKGSDLQFRDLSRVDVRTKP